MKVVLMKIFADAADHALFLVPLVALPYLYVLAQTVPRSAPEQVIT